MDKPKRMGRPPREIKRVPFSTKVEPELKARIKAVGRKTVDVVDEAFREYLDKRS